MLHGPQTHRLGGTSSGILREPAAARTTVVFALHLPSRSGKGHALLWRTPGWRACASTPRGGRLVYATPFHCAPAPLQAPLSSLTAYSSFCGVLSGRRKNPACWYLPITLGFISKGCLYVAFH